MNETNENKILDTLHRIVVHDRKRPVIHRTTNINSVYSRLILLQKIIFFLFVI